MSGVFHDARLVRVIASAGCGKTTFIKNEIDNLLLAGVKPLEICYILFNRKPALAFKEEYAKRGLFAEEMIWWGTHHGLAKRLLNLKSKNIIDLSEWGKSHGFDISSEDELREEGVNEYGWDAVAASLSKKIYRAESDFTTEERRLLDALIDTEMTEGKYTHVRYLQKALRLNLFPSGVKYMFVDEAQDNGKMQFDWIQRAADSRVDVRGILLAGDDKQAINRFKGGDPELFLNFPVEKTIELTTTYRMPAPVLKEANRIISPVRERSSLTLTSESVYAGSVIYAQRLDDAMVDVQQGIREKKKILILLRNKCFENNVRRVLHEHAVPVRSEWHREIKNIVAALSSIRKTGNVYDWSLAALIPTSKENTEGRFKIGAYWDVEKIQKLRSGQFLTDATMFRAYEFIRLDKGLPLERIVDPGFTKDFVDDVRSWNIPLEKFYLSPSNMMNFKLYVQMYGFDFDAVRIETIHAVKGEEADVVVLVSNVTNKSADDTDDERRVWYVGASRSRGTLIFTSLPTHHRRTPIL